MNGICTSYVSQVIINNMYGNYTCEPYSCESRAPDTYWTPAYIYAPIANHYHSCLILLHILVANIYPGMNRYATWRATERRSEKCERELSLVINSTPVFCD